MQAAGWPLRGFFTDSELDAAVCKIKVRADVALVQAGPVGIPIRVR